MEWRTWLWVLVVMCSCDVWLRVAVGFNLDIENSRIYKGKSNTMFGFSVAQHVSRGESWLLVGAPRAQTKQPGVIRGGAVYKCEASRQGYTCQDEIPFDRAGNANTTDGKQEDDKSEQWFGATVKSGGPDGPILACAPRYVFYTKQRRDRRDPVGNCFIALPLHSGAYSGFEFEPRSPCRTSAWGYHRQGSCQAGFGADLSPDGNWTFIGAVGSWYWQGQVFSYDEKPREVVQYATPEGGSTEDNSYFGYSLAVGEFTGDAEPDIAVGMPRGMGPDGKPLVGKVILMSATLERLHNLTGETFGEYFGYSVAVCDVNGDGRDDVLVGSPLYTDKNDPMRWEIGKVSVAMHNSVHKFRRWDLIEGFQIRSRFGMAIASLKDLDRDGFGDFAVGAPYGGEDGRGMVYIFRGSSNGVIKEPSQKIEAGKMPGELRGFGFSLSGGMDMDGNHYPDLLIGAVNSDAIAYLRARPIVNITGFMEFNANLKMIDLETRRCVLPRSGINVPCVTYQYCLAYSDIGDPVNYIVTLEVQEKLDALKSRNPRLFFLDRERHNAKNVTIDLWKGQRRCQNGTAYVDTTVRDKLTPLVGEISYTLRGVRETRDLKPILGLVTSVTDQLSIQKNCGTDNICIPDLQVTSNLNRKTFLLGSQETLELEVMVKNGGEDAYEAMTYLHLPPGVSFVRATKSLSHTSPILVLCTPEKRLLKCDIGNPLPTNGKVAFKVTLQPQALKEDEESTLKALKFQLEVNSTNPEEEGSTNDNSQTISVDIQVETDLILSGVTIPETLRYNRSDFKLKDHAVLSDIGPEVTHRYFLENKGPSGISEAEAYVLWPTWADSGDYLLYLVEQPKTEGSGFCEKVADVNPLNLHEPVKQKEQRRNAIPPEKPSSNNELRQKRKAQPEYMWMPQYEKEVKDCEHGRTKCTIIKCTVGPLAQGEKFILTLNSRLWISTLSSLGYADVAILSKMVSRVTSLPHRVDPGYLGYKVTQARSVINPEDERFGDRPVAWWIYVLAVFGGLLLLALLILLLYKLGFFKRKRPKESPGMGPEVEREPLNGYDHKYNYHQGDAAL